jgi:hypothetical protein
MLDLLFLMTLTLSTYVAFVDNEHNQIIRWYVSHSFLPMKKVYCNPWIPCSDRSLDWYNPDVAWDRFTISSDADILLYLAIEEQKK